MEKGSVNPNFEEDYVEALVAVGLCMLFELAVEEAVDEVLEEI